MSRVQDRWCDVFGEIDYFRPASDTTCPHFTLQTPASDLRKLIFGMFFVCMSFEHNHGRSSKDLFLGIEGMLGVRAGLDKTPRFSLSFSCPQNDMGHHQKNSKLFNPMPV